MAIDINDLPPEYQRQVLAKYTSRGDKPKPKRNKYGNVKTAAGDSKGEVARGEELKLMQQSGIISELKFQPHFTLQEAFTTPDGERVAAIKYIADFAYCRDGKLVVEDYKSSYTRKLTPYRMKYRLMQERYGITITEVTK